MVAGDLLLDVTQEVLERERLTASGVAFLFDDDDRILAHPRMAELMGGRIRARLPRLRETDMPGVAKAIRAWRANGIAEQFFSDPAAGSMSRPSRRSLVRVPADIRLAVVAPVDEFFAGILSERGRLFVVALGFVAAMVPIVFSIGSMLSRSLRKLADETDRIQRFEPSVVRPCVR